MINRLQSLVFTACMLSAWSAGAVDAVDTHVLETNPLDKIAQQNLSEDDYIGDVPKVLTVSRLAQSKEDSPSAVTVIDSATIRASGIVDIPELFRLVPGFYVGKNAGYIYNSNHVVSYHGMASAYAGAMQVLINGRSVYSPLYGGINWSELPITVDDIDRIEITRGPNAASYGANSFFGVISIITKDTKDSTGSSVRLTHGTGRNEAFYRYGGALNDVNFRVSAGYREDDGLDNRNDFKRTNILNLQADKRIDARNEINLELGITNGDRADGEAARDKTLFVPRTRDILNHYELIHWRHSIGEDSDFSLQAFHSSNSSDDKITSVNLRPGITAAVFNIEYAKEYKKARQLGLSDKAAKKLATQLATPLALAAGNSLLADGIAIDNDIDLERYDIEAQHTFTLYDNLRFVWGGNIRLDTTYAPHWLGTGETDYFNLQRLFGHVEWRMNDHFLVNIGSMVEHNSFTGTDVSPRASLNFKLTPNHALRFGVSTATRTPNDIEEKFNDVTVIPTSTATTYILQNYASQGKEDPERIVSKEIGYLGQIGNLNIDAKVFYDDVSQILNTERPNFALPSTTVLLSKKLTKKLYQCC